jgi:Fe2+ or Zn2+ uptake regulation protein
MMKLDNILGTLKSGGFRITRARRAIITLFLDAKAPLSVPEVSEGLRRMKIKVNKTTVYREVDFLKSQDMLRELHMGDRKSRYEMKYRGHHHHLFCVGCSGVECVELEKCLEAEEKRIFRENRFKTMKHSLKFIGLCAECQQTQGG